MESALRVLLIFAVFVAVLSQCDPPPSLSDDMYSGVVYPPSLSYEYDHSPSSPDCDPRPGLPPPPSLGSYSPPASLKYPPPTYSYPPPSLGAYADPCGGGPPPSLSNMMEGDHSIYFVPLPASPPSLSSYNYEQPIPSPSPNDCPPSPSLPPPPSLSLAYDDPDPCDGYGPPPSLSSLHEGDHSALFVPPPPLSPPPSLTSVQYDYPTELTSSDCNSRLSLPPTPLPPPPPPSLSLKDPCEGYHHSLSYGTVDPIPPPPSLSYEYDAPPPSLSYEYNPPPIDCGHTLSGGHHHHQHPSHQQGGPSSLSADIPPVIPPKLPILPGHQPSYDLDHMRDHVHLTCICKKDSSKQGCHDHPHGQHHPALRKAHHALSGAYGADYVKDPCGFVALQRNKRSAEKKEEDVKPEVPKTRRKEARSTKTRREEARSQKRRNREGRNKRE